MDSSKVVEGYLKRVDWKVRENANLSYSFSSLFMRLASEAMEEYVLDRVYTPEIAKAHREGDFHLHNLQMGIVGYCAGWSIPDVLIKGFAGVPARTESAPAKHFSTALLQLANFVGTLQNEWSISKDELVVAANENHWKVEEISKLPEKINVFTFDNNLKIKTADGKVIRHRRAPLLEIVCWHGTKIKITEDHSLFTFSGGKKIMPVKGKELRKGDKIVIPLSLPFLNEEQVFDLKETSTEKVYGDKEIYLERSGYKLKRFLPLNKALASLLGFFVTEGTTRENKVGTDISFLIARKEKELENEIVRACKKLGLPHRIYRPAFRPNETYLFIGSKLIRDLFIAKCGRKEKIVPSEIFRGKRSIVAAFLKACFSGDGCIKIEKHGGVRVCFKSTVSKLRAGILYLLRMFGIVGKPSGMNIYIGDRRYVAKFWKEIGFFQKEKMQKLKNYLGRVKATDTERKLEVIPESDLGLVEIKNIRRLPKEEVYDISVPETENFVGGANPICLHNSGAQAYNSLDTLLAPFVAVDKLSYKEVKQHMQQFIFNLNITSRWGGQSPFTNITFDLKPPEDLRNTPVTIGGKPIGETYGEFQNEMDLINKAFMEVMAGGDIRGRTFTFPLPTYNITKDFDWNSELSNLMFEMTAKYGAPYFQNFVGSDLNPKDIRAMCCRLRLDLREMYRRVGGFFGYADKTGSVGVVTINLPRIAFEAKGDDAKFFERLAELMELAKQSLEIKREVVQKNIDAGLLPYTKKYLGTLRWHFSTIGLVGGNEAVLNFGIQGGIASKKGKVFATKTLEFMKKKLLEFQNETGHIYNLEATPVEGATHRLALLDKRKYLDIITAGGKEPYYTNSTHLPVNYTNDVFEALEHQDDLQVIYTGGTVFHCFLGERISGDAAKMLVKKIVLNFKLPYFTLTPTFSICQEHGYISGEHFKCPACGKPCEVYSRVVGYYRPVQQWNAGKQEEFNQRLEYKVE